MTTPAHQRYALLKETLTRAEQQQQQRPAAQQQQRGQSSQQGDLEIIDEQTMVELPRGREGEGREVVRLLFVRARSREGRDVAWHELREFYLAENGEWRRGRRGISIRARELVPIRDALVRATSGGASR